jgi:hypothetical protein
MGTPVVSDDIGIFSKNISWLTQESNIIVAELIDGSNAVIASSPEIKFDKGNWNWCPYNKNFECQTSITADMVINRISRYL